MNDKYLVVECKDCGYKAIYRNGKADDLICEKCNSSLYIPIDGGSKAELIARHNIGESTSRIFLESIDGTRKLIREIEAIDKDCDVLIFKLKIRLMSKDISKLEAELTQKTGKKCVVIDGMFDSVLGVR